jgi:hypothetical protein
MPINAAALIRPMSVRKTPETDPPHPLVTRWMADWLSPSRAVSDRMPSASRVTTMKTTELCPRLSQNSTLSGRLLSPHELAGRVVDGCDVIGVERVRRAERVCRHAQSDPQELTADRLAVRCHDADQSTPQPTLCSSRMKPPMPHKLRRSSPEIAA